MTFTLMDKIIRNKTPEISNFYILHEGLIADLDGELIEEDYDNIQEKKFTRTAQTGWLGIGDKYWITSLIPAKGKEFKTTFDYKKKYRANFVSTEPQEIIRKRNYSRGNTGHCCSQKS